MPRLVSGYGDCDRGAGLVDSDFLSILVLGRFVRQGDKFGLMDDLRTLVLEICHPWKIDLKGVLTLEAGLDEMKVSPCKKKVSEERLLAGSWNG